MVLSLLEFSDCLLDSPFFRESLKSHEKALAESSDGIRNLVKVSRNVNQSARDTSRLNSAFAKALSDFNFRHADAGENESDVTAAETLIGSALGKFGDVLQEVEDNRSISLDQSDIILIEPLEDFRKVEIGAVREEKRRFDKQSEKFLGTVDKTMSMSYKHKKSGHFTEADALLETEQATFTSVYMGYVQKLNELKEKEKFEFVEKLLAYMYSQMTFFHQAYETLKGLEPFMKDLSLKLQNTRDLFETEKLFSDELMQKVVLTAEEKRRLRFCNGELVKSKDAYTFTAKARKGVLTGNTWSRHFCQYEGTSKVFSVCNYRENKMVPPDIYSVVSWKKIAAETVDRRFCFEIHTNQMDKSLIVQAIGQKEYDEWILILGNTLREIEVIGGSPPPALENLVNIMKESVPPRRGSNQTGLSKGMMVVEHWITYLDKNLDTEGLYRVSGVKSKVASFLQASMSNIRTDGILDETPATVAGALKLYFRDLPEPLMTFGAHMRWIDAAKEDDREKRLIAIQEELQRLPPDSYALLKLLVEHLSRVAARSDKNLMLPSNLAVVFGPTLMRSEEDSVCAIMNIKYQNIVIESLVEHCDRLFRTKNPSDIADTSNSEYDVIIKPIPRPLGRSQTPPPRPTKPSFLAGGYSPKSSRPAAQSVSERTFSPVGAKKNTPPPKPRTTVKLLPKPGRGKWSKALYSCIGDVGELSFEAGDVISNISETKETGWIEGTNEKSGIRGLVPINYVGPTF